MASLRPSLGPALLLVLAGAVLVPLLALRPVAGQAVVLLFPDAAGAERALPLAAAAGWRPVRLDGGAWAALHLAPDDDALPPAALSRLAGAALALAARALGGCAQPRRTT